MDFISRIRLFFNRIRLWSKLKQILFKDSILHLNLSVSILQLSIKLMSLKTHKIAFLNNIFYCSFFRWRSFLNCLVCKGSITDHIIVDLFLFILKSVKQKFIFLTRKFKHWISNEVALHISRTYQWVTILLWITVNLLLFFHQKSCITSFSCSDDEISSLQLRRFCLDSLLVV